MNGFPLVGLGLRTQDLRLGVDLGFRVANAM